jgi:quinoprotein glucose dehydrogenase
MSRRLLAVPAFALAAALVTSANPPQDPKPAAQKKTPADEALATVKLADKGLKAEVWAAEPLLANPVAFAFDEKGRAFVAETTRFGKGVPDTRGHMYWLDEDLANRSIDDLLAMYKKHKYQGYEKYNDQLRLVWDDSGSGKADKSTVFAGGFNRPQDGLAAGVLARKGDVYFACIPDLYLLKDTTGDNRADVKKSLFTGFGPTAQFLGHDLHGLRMGPDGRLYFSIGDRGFNVTTKEGKKLEYPNTGAVLRCDPDGGNLEVVHYGLRNPQEIAFDDHGNLFTFDNNSDSGDQARWVHVVEGGDSGWRGGYQYGTLYHTPAVPQGNRGPFNTEKLWLPHFEGQAAYIVPPLANFGNGPAGLVHYPGVGLSDKYKDHFFACDFTSNAGSSVIWAVAVKPKGASFEVARREPFVRGMVPTDCDFGPDGAFYWSDWTGGWDPPGKGRIFRVTDPEAMKNPAVAEAKKLLAEGFDKLSADELERLLAHPHQQVRQEAQFELVELKADGRLAKVARESANRLARLHGVWGLGMIARKNRDTVAPLVGLLKDPDAEVRRAAVEQLGNVVRSAGRGEQGPAAAGVQAEIVKLLADPDLRVRAAAAVAYGKIGQPVPVVRRPQSEQAFFAPLFDLLKANDDKDPHLRHAAVMGLVHAARNPTDLWNAWTLAKGKYDIASVRMGVLLALRKHKSDKVAEFLSDAEPRLVAEAARAVYDERLTTALPTLAKLADKTGQPDAVAFRALAANYVLGTPEAAGRVAKFAGRASEPDYTRAFALKLLGDWTAPPRRDPITGLTLDLPKRDEAVAATALKAAGPALFTGSDAVRTQAAQTAAKLGVKDFGPVMAGIVRDAKQPVALRAEALYAAEALKDPAARDLAAEALASDEPRLRAAGRAVRAKLDPQAVLAELPTLLRDEKASPAEKQGAFAILAAQRGRREGAAADKLLDEWLDEVLADKVPPELILDVLDAAEARADAPKQNPPASLKQKVEKYRAAQAQLAAAKDGDKLAPYREALAGGDPARGRDIVLNNSAVYCQRCHKLDGQGGGVGPELNGIAADKDKDRRYLLESIVLPNAKIAKGYETVILLLEDESTVSGVVKGEDGQAIRLVTAENKELVIPVKDVAARRTGPSAMPDDLHKKLTRRELRDVVEFLASLNDPPKK